MPASANKKRFIPKGDLANLYFYEAEEMFVARGMGLPAIEKALKIRYPDGKLDSSKTAPSQGTLDRWRRQCAWNEMRAQENRTPLQLAQTMDKSLELFNRDIHEATVDGDTAKLAKLYDGALKNQALIDKMRGKQNFRAQTMRVLRAMVAFAAESGDTKLNQALGHSGKVVEIYSWIVERFKA